MAAGLRTLWPAKEKPPLGASPNWFDDHPPRSLPLRLCLQKFVLSSLSWDSPEFVSAKISRLVQANHPSKRQRNAVRIRKPRRRPRQPTPPHRLQRLLHPRLLPKRSGVADKPRLQQEQVQPSLLRRLPRVNAQPTQRPAQQLQRQVLRHQLHQLNSAWAICSSRRILRHQGVPQQRCLPQQRARAPRQRQKRLRLAEAMALFGLTPKRMFITQKARVSTGPLKRADT
jgi:hypothetical protein